MIIGKTISVDEGCYRGTMNRWIELETKERKYRWHDLRKDPYDLPEEEFMVEVVNDDGIHMFAERVDPSDAVAINSDGTSWQYRNQPYDKDTWFESECGLVVAWRHIELINEELKDYNEGLRKENEKLKTDNKALEMIAERERGRANGLMELAERICAR